MTAGRIFHGGRCFTKGNFAVRRSRRPLEACIVLVLVFSAVPACAADSDTSYGDYRVKEKERERERTGSGGRPGQRYRSDESDTGSIFSNCLGGCFNGFFDLLTQRRPDTSSYVSPASRQREVYEFDEQNFRDAIGVGLGMLAYSGISTGFQVNVFNHVYFLPLQPFTLRANLGVDFSINSIKADFERDVFVDTGKVGTQTITTSSYHHGSMPLMIELMVRPSGKDGSFYFVAGGGAGLIYEFIRGEKTTSYTAQRKDTACSAFHVRPAMSLGLGWLTTPGKRFGSIEFYYRTLFGRLDRREPLPGANTSNSHSITLGFSIIF
jgi:hypothetical protein